MLTALRAVGVYLLMLVVIRALGKRTVGNFAPFDLLVALMLGELVDEIIFADVSFLQGTIAIVVIAGAQSANSWLTWWGHGFDNLLEGKPTVVVRDGRPMIAELRVFPAEAAPMPNLEWPVGEWSGTWNRDAPVPVILVTGHHDADLLHRAAADYVMAYLTKPVKPADLESVDAILAESVG